MPSQLPVPLTQTLTPKMLEFVEHYVDLGGRHQGRAAIMAGYSSTAADALASRLLRRPDVLALLRHIVETRIKADAVASAGTLKELRDDPATPAAVRRQCANDLLDRAGLLVEKFSTVRHVVDDMRAMTGDDLLRSLRTFAPDVGMELVVRDQAKLDHFLTAMNSSAAPAVIDGEFEEVDDGNPEAAGGLVAFDNSCG